MFVNGVRKCRGVIRAGFGQTQQLGRSAIMLMRLHVPARRGPPTPATTTTTATTPTHPSHLLHSCLLALALPDERAAPIPPGPAGCHTGGCCPPARLRCCVSNVCLVVWASGSPQAAASPRVTASLLLPGALPNPPCHHSGCLRCAFWSAAVCLPLPRLPAGHSLSALLRFLHDAHALTLHLPRLPRLLRLPCLQAAARALTIAVFLTIGFSNCLVFGPDLQVGGPPSLGECCKPRGCLGACRVGRLPATHGTGKRLLCRMPIRMPLSCSAAGAWPAN